MMSGMENWGPSHQSPYPPRSGRGPDWRWGVRALVALAILGISVGGTPKHTPTSQIVFGAMWVAFFAIVAMPRSLQHWAGQRIKLLRPANRALLKQGQAKQLNGDPLVAVLDAARSWGGVYLGVTQEGHVRCARYERAVMVLGPPRGGKSSAIIIPAVITHLGPVVSASTKPDVANATRGSRSRLGRTWQFDPTGTSGAAGGSLVLRWSPVTSCVQWDSALLMARAMTVTVGAGTTDRSHWSSRAQALLAPLLHAAAVHGRGMDAVVGWVMRHEIDEPGNLLEDSRCSQLAFSSLVGVFNTEDRERSSIFSATADALQAYTSENALAAARNPNFDVDAFVRSRETVYICAAAEEQAACAPIVCGLLSEIRRATYRAHAQGRLSAGRILFALDEVANIAPLEELPQIASEGGGQGLTLLIALQDLSQARQRWGSQADGFLTLFGTKVILPGVADQRTLEAVSSMLGEYDRQVVSHNKPQYGLSDFIAPTHSMPHNSTTTSTQRTRVLSPGEVANIPAGHALHLDGVRWQLITLTPAYTTDPWRTIINQTR